MYRSKRTIMAAIGCSFELFMNEMNVNLDSVDQKFHYSMLLDWFCKSW